MFSGCFLNWLGVMPVCFLNALLKADLELNPDSYNTSSIVRLLLLGSDNFSILSLIL